MRAGRRLAAHSAGVIYASHLILLIEGYVNYMPSRLIDEANMENAHDWLSRLLEMMPVKGTVACAGERRLRGATRNPRAGRGAGRPHAPGDAQQGLLSGRRL